MINRRTSVKPLKVRKLRRPQQDLKASYRDTKLKPGILCRSILLGGRQDTRLSIALITDWAKGNSTCKTIRQHSQKLQQRELHGWHSCCHSLASSFRGRLCDSVNSKKSGANFDWCRTCETDTCADMLRTVFTLFSSPSRILLTLIMQSLPSIFTLLILRKAMFE